MRYVVYRRIPIEGAKREYVTLWKPHEFFWKPHINYATRFYEKKHAEDFIKIREDTYSLYLKINSYLPIYDYEYGIEEVEKDCI